MSCNLSLLLSVRRINCSINWHADIVQYIIINTLGIFLACLAVHSMSWWLINIYAYVLVTALCSEGSMFRRFYVQKIFVQKVLCSEGPIFRRSFVQKVLCSEKLCSKRPIFRRFDVQKVLYSDIFRRSYIQKILCFMWEKTFSFR